MAMEAASHVLEADYRHGQRLVFRRRLFPLVACDLAIAADEAVFGLSEINWGIPPGNLVSKAMADTVGHRQALYYIMTGDTFDGKEAAAMGLVNSSVPLEQLRAKTVALAAKLLEKNPVVLRAAKHGFKRSRELTWEQNEDYLYAKLDQAQLRDPEKGREEGLRQFLDQKSIKPGLQAYKRTGDEQVNINPVACPHLRAAREKACKGDSHRERSKYVDRGQGLSGVGRRHVRAD